jgi:hypothetical protein
MLTRRGLFTFLAAAPVAAVANPYATGGVAEIADLPRFGEVMAHINAQVDAQELARIRAKIADANMRVLGVERPKF